MKFSGFWLELNKKKVAIIGKKHKLKSGVYLSAEGRSLGSTSHCPRAASPAASLEAFIECLLYCTETG